MNSEQAFEFVPALCSPEVAAGGADFSINEGLKVYIVLRRIGP